jgi:histidinol-phosphate aminotransferase
MHGYVPGEQPPAGSRLIKLNTNENPYPPSPRVAEAIAAAIADGGASLRRYSDPTAAPIRDAAAAALGVPADWDMEGNGSDELLSVLVRAFVGEGEPLCYPYPTYSLYRTLAEIQGARAVEIDFDADFALPQALVQTGARLAFVANPNSPSGTLHSLDALARLAAGVDGALVVDEAYAAFSGQTAIPLLAAHDNVAVVRTLSKSHSLAGLRVGLLVARPAMIAGLMKVRDSYSVDRLAIAAGAASLADTAWLAHTTARVLATRARLVDGLTALGLAPLPTAANFAFVRMGGVARARAAHQFLRERDILVRYFSARLVDDGLRITVGTDDEIDALLDAMAAFVASEPSANA